MTADIEDATPRGRAGIVLFDPPEGAPELFETGMMSMPTIDPPAPTR